MSALDAALEAVDRCIPEPREEDAAIIRAKIRGLLRGYDARWGNAGWETVSTEEEFHLPLVNPETGRESRTFTHAGKYDGIVRWPASGRLLLLEHKTTTDDITDPNAPYWRRLQIDSQVSHYMLANWQSGRKLDGTLYDVLKKPTIRPKDISKADQKLLVTWGTYCGQEVPLHLRDLTRENAELYEIRLYADTLERPDFYFGRRPVNRMDQEIAEFSGELWDIAQALIHARNTNSNFKNDNSCLAYGSACEYLGVCSGIDSFESGRWARAESVHSELEGVGDGRSVLTHSRLKCFQLCRRKHFNRYEIGMKRVDEEDREALFFGHVMHESLRVWFDCFREEVSHGNGNCSPVNAAGECPTPNAQ